MNFFDCSQYNNEYYKLSKKYYSLQTLWFHNLNFIESSHFRVWKLSQNNYYSYLEIEGASI